MIRPLAARLRARIPGGPTRLAAGATSAALLAAALTVPAAASPPQPATGPPPPTAEEAGDRPPLAVSIDSLTPSTVPRRGRLTLTGEIANRSKSRWTDLKVYLFTSETPMTDSSELEEATATNPALEVGGRLTTPGLYTEVDDLEPGESTSYRLSVARSDLPFEEEGVYWIGVHVLGSDEKGRVDGADGRARTFIPLMADRTPRTDLALVVPLRARVRRTTEGRLADVARWERRLGGEGRLSRLVDLAQTAPDVPITWLVDPAVLDAASSLAAGNPSFDLAPTEGPSAPSASSSPDAPLTESPSPGQEDLAEELDDLAEESATAQAWLSEFTDVAAEDEILALPYGDVDAATLLRGDFGRTLRSAHDLSTGVMENLALESEPVVAPLDGLLPQPALDRHDPQTPLILSERSVATDATTVRLGEGTEAVVTSDAARIGGPAPTAPHDALALRQRILAEAAVHGLAHGPARPLVVSTPEKWNPGPDWRSAAFFGGLDVPWIRSVDLAFASAVSQAEEYDRPLSYTRADRARELPVANVLATQDLYSAGSVLAQLLTRNDTIDEQVGRAAMLGSSTHARARPERAAARTRDISREVHGRLSSVYIDVSELVTMSSEQGIITVTMVNDLQEPVAVAMKVETGTDELRIRPPDLVSLGPGQRATVRLAVTATDTGVHSVRFIPTTEDGRPLGRTTQVKIRSSQVGLVIWLIIGTGAAVFVAAIVARIVRRIRARKRTHGPKLKDRST